MSSFFFITPYDPILYSVDPPPETSPSDLRININDFIERLEERWHPVTIYQEKVHMAVSWEIQQGLVNLYDGKEYPFYASLHSDLQTISFRWINDFILWYRQYIPASYDLFFFNESSWDSIKLVSTTTLRDIGDFLARR